ncbi:MAG TPA: hypothetical protein VKZ53_01075 [Candidatus Angelobacter sp.]|nr:hypothetical protein [Candidatus Angelobacter sp.]
MPRILRFRISSFVSALCLLLLSLFFSPPQVALKAEQQPDPGMYEGLHWRMIGPFRGGRTIAVSGLEHDPSTYYFGGVGGGVWKTTNGGETWQPIFDGQPIASIGALAVAPSDTNILYVGTGEADLRSDITYGNGVYKSSDGGKTWKHLGLADSHHISRIVVDPHNPNKVLMAVLGHAYGPNSERGVYRSDDGGANWKKVLYKDENTGAIDIALDPENPQIIFAALWSARRPPWTTYPPINGSGAIYKSVDGGATWKPVTGGGLPSGSWGRVGLAVGRGQRVYALIDIAPDPADASRQGGLFRSDNGGQTWTLAGTDARIRGRLWYFGEVDVDPKNPDIVYLPNVSIYRSTDAGRTFTAIKGAPGGDDYHTLWIDPSNTRRMIFGSDQGACVSVDGGKSWTSWYNQPTAQFYHVAVNNEFPYRVFGAQQDSGTVSTTSRGDDGSITFRDWHPIGAGESGYIAPDPVDPNIVYGGDTYGGLHRFDRRTGQSQNIAPEPVGGFGATAQLDNRFTWTSPLVFSPQDHHVLYFGSQFLLRSGNGGMSWERISPDLTGNQADASAEGPLTVQNAKARGHGVIYTIAPSPLAAGQIWVGTDTGLIQLTRDNGKTWADVTPPHLGDWAKISLIDASHFDAGTIYAAIDRHRLDDAAPYIYTTNDYGATWRRITYGIPEGAYVRAVREDPIRKGLLFAGTELGVYFSLNDGRSWQPLRLNMPVAPIHDLVIKDNDLVAATHGRSFWILDDITPLRQTSPEMVAKGVHLFEPATAIRIRASVNTDTPLTPETPAGENPPTGAVIYYSLKSAVQTPVTLEVADTSGKILRRYSSDDKPPAPQLSNIAFPSYWFRKPTGLARDAGLHRFVWDLRLALPELRSPGYSMATAFGQNTPTDPQGPQVLPGSYEIRLTAAGTTVRQKVEVKMDPRLQASSDDLQKQFALQMKITDALWQIDKTLADIREVLDSHVRQDVAKKLEELTGASRRRRAAAAEDETPGDSTFLGVNGVLLQLAIVVDSADAAPTAQATEAVEQALARLRQLQTQWESIKPK